MSENIFDNDSKCNKENKIEKNIVDVDIMDGHTDAEIKYFLIAKSKKETLKMDSFWSLNQGQELDNFVIEFILDLITENTNVSFLPEYAVNNLFHSEQAMERISIGCLPS